jgi:hypothetical protein
LTLAQKTLVRAQKKQSGKIMGRSNAVAPGAEGALILNAQTNSPPQKKAISPLRRRSLDAAHQ